jgi:hypothetical protein
VAKVTKSVGVGSFILLAGAVGWACSGKSVTLGEASQSSSAEATSNGTGATSNDSSGSGGAAGASFDDDVPLGGFPSHGLWVPPISEVPEYGMCSNDFDYQNGCSGFLATPLGDEFGRCSFACQCHEHVDEDEECPSPETGNVVPHLGADGRCTLPCDSESICPDGMACAHISDHDSQCTWLIHDEDAFSCNLKRFPDWCDQYQTRDACEARIRTNPYLPSDGCIWVKETYHETSANSCAPIRSEERCVPGSALDSDYECAESQCGYGDPVVYFSEPSAGTLKLTEVATCYFMPSTQDGREFERCSFDGSSSPEKCGCACE